MDGEAATSLIPTRSPSSGMMDDEKENLYNIPEDEDGLAELDSVKAMPVELKRNRKAGACNLRKSLAWNRAFFTEEGVLDPLELSMLNESIKSQGSSAATNVGITSPLTELNLSSERQKVVDMSRNSGGNAPGKCQRKITDASHHSSKSQFTFNARESNKVPLKILVPKGPSKNTLQAPSTYSTQKRVSNMSTVNPTTKVPKIMPKLKQIVATDSSQRSTTILGSGSSKVMEFGQSLSAKVVTNDSMKDELSNVEKSRYSFKIPSSSSMIKPLEPCAGASSYNKSSGLPQNQNHVNKGLSAPVYGKPTALRMPSPTLGFFSQGKTSLSYDAPFSRNMKPTISNLPSEKDTDIGVSKLLCRSVGKKTTAGCGATKVTSESIISKSKVQQSVASFSKPSLLATKSNVVTNGTNRSHYSHHSSVCELTNRMSDPSLNKEVPPEHGSMKMNCGFSSEEMLKEPVDTTAFDNFSDGCPSIGNGFHSKKSSSEIPVSKVAEETHLKPQIGVRAVENPANCSDANDADIFDLAISSAPSITSTKCISAIDASLAELDKPLATKMVPLIYSGTTEAREVQFMESKSNDYQECNVQHDLLTQKPKEARQMEEAAVTKDNERCAKNVKVNPDVQALRCQINAVPFSDEWLAALEAFGEDILHLKSGAVQNSPTDKALSEPGPWSPVKRKTQDIGPFDCTKYAKNIETSDS